MRQQRVEDKIELSERGKESNQHISPAKLHEQQKSKYGRKPYSEEEPERERQINWNKISIKLIY